MIQLASGAYYLSYPLNTLGKDVTLQGAVPPPNVTRPSGNWPSTTIHATGAWPVLHCSGGESPTFQYLHVTGGAGYNGYGGGLEVSSSSPLVNACRFDHNIASEEGGAIACIHGSSVTVTNSLITKNSSMKSIGGAVYTDSTSNIMLVSSVICGNIIGPGSCGNAASQLSGNYMTKACEINCLGCDANPSGDLNHDGFTDGADLTVLLSAWGSSEATVGACCHLGNGGQDVCTMTWEGECESTYGGTYYPNQSCSQPEVPCDYALLSTIEWGVCCYDEGGAKACKFMTKADCNLEPNSAFFAGVTNCDLVTRGANPQCQTGEVVLCCGCLGGAPCRYLTREACLSCSTATGAPGCVLPEGQTCQTQVCSNCN